MAWMLRRIRKKLIFVVVVVFFVYILLWKTPQKILKSVHDSLTGNKTNLDAFLVDTPSCKIQKVDPYDVSIHHLVRKTRSRVCPNNASITYEKGTVLHINWTSIKAPPYNGDIKYCTYTPIHRPKYVATHNNYLRYLEESGPFNGSVAINHDFVRVACYDHHDNRVYVNFHAFIQTNETSEAMLKERFTNHILRDKITERLNVIMIGIDSVSRLSFLRQMQKTGSFLRNTLGAADMMGYNKVADNTFINIVPMTTGKFVVELPWDETMSAEPFDKYDFIWKQFSQNGYRTFYAEDAPEISIFDFIKAGFQIPPADFFNRPMSLAMEMKEELWFNNHNCFQDRLETQIVLDYLYNFVETFQHDPYFAFTFITRLTHDDVNSAGAADEPYFNFFKKLYDKGLLQNTVLFFFSDHGMRFGKIRETYIGKLEERLPFMYMAVPKWLRDNHPLLEKNMRLNEHRLSTPFDVYETLRDILYFDGIEKSADDKSRGVSWFREIPTDRSCETADILPHWCTCLIHQKLDVMEEIVHKSSVVLLLEIKFELRDHEDICETLSLSEIREATRLVSSDDVLKFVKSENDVKNKNVIFGERTQSFEDIQVVIRTHPGDALFEATVRIDRENDTYKVVGDISRINVYGHQSDCMDNFKLKKFCQCRNYKGQ